MKVGDVDVVVVGKTIRWTAGLSAEVDGSSVAYAPPASGLVGLDYLANAGSPGHWYGIVCNSQGVPYVQQQGHPAPGYYVSATKLCDGAYGDKDPRRYVDAVMVPYIAIPPELKVLGAKLGDVALVSYGDREASAICADIGPKGKIGEGSIRLHQALGSDPYRRLPRHRLTGIDAGVSVILFVGSSRGWPRSLSSIDDQVQQLKSLSIMV